MSSWFGPLSEVCGKSSGWHLGWRGRGVGEEGQIVNGSLGSTNTQGQVERKEAMDRTELSSQRGRKPEAKGFQDGGSGRPW